MSEIPPKLMTADSRRASEVIGVPLSSRSPEERARELLHLRGLLRCVLALPGMSEQDRSVLASEDERARAELDAIAVTGLDVRRLAGGAVVAGRIHPHASSTDRT